MTNRAPFINGWFIWAGSLVLIAAIVASGNIHLGPEHERISPWNWGWVAFMAALVIGGRSYQYFVQKR